MKIEQYGEMGTIKALIINGEIFTRVFINEDFIWYKPTETGFEVLIEDAFVHKLEAAYTDAYVKNEINYVSRAQ